jgi:hypothetical protein
MRLSITQDSTKCSQMRGKEGFGATSSLQRPFNTLFASQNQLYNLQYFFKWDKVSFTKHVRKTQHLPSHVGMWASK